MAFTFNTYRYLSESEKDAWQNVIEVIPSFVCFPDLSYLKERNSSCERIREILACLI